MSCLISSLAIGRRSLFPLPPPKAVCTRSPTETILVGLPGLYYVFPFFSLGRVHEGKVWV